MIKTKLSSLPAKIGVYILKNKRGKILYIGKSTNIRHRARTHLKNDRWRAETARVNCVLASNEAEALIKESELIKKHKPRYNILLRDDKQYFYVGLSRDNLPRLIITHQPQNKTRYLGPFTDGKSLKTVLRYLRKPFPYYTQKHRRLPCSYCHIGLCPGPNPNVAEYKKDITKIKAILSGKRPSVISSLKKDMARFAKNLEFEKAAKARDQIKALENIFSHKSKVESSLLVSRGFEGCFGTVPRRGQNSPNLRAPRWRGENDARYPIAKIKVLNDIRTLEAYDISNIQGKEPVASMVRFDNGKPNKSMYRKFKIRLPEKPNDVAMIKEVIRRRLKHAEWPYPNIFLIDGGKGQLNAALSERDKKQETRNKRQDIYIVALAKRFNELYVPGKKSPIPLAKLPEKIKNLFMHARDEAHRFAISYHRKLHRQSFRKDI